MNWHRRLGIVAAILFIFAATTGLLLNHASDIKLNERVVTSNWILAWYDIAPKSEPLSFETNGQWLVWIDGNLYNDQHHLGPLPGKPVGVVLADHVIIAASTDQISLYTETGQTIENQKAPFIPTPVEAIGLAPDGRPIVRVDGSLFSCDANFTNWGPLNVTGNVAWSGISTQAPQQVLDAAIDAFRGRGLPLDRILLDVHTGRFFGPAGKYLMDAVAIVLVFLALTGAYSWFRYLQRD